MPTKFYTYRCKCFCIMLFVGIILYAALNTLCRYRHKVFAAH